MTHAEVAAELKISVRELWSLSSNPSFPRPIGNDAEGNIVWNSEAITAFASQWSAIKAHGWRITPSLLPTMDIRAMASAAPGRHYVHAHMGDPLFG